MNTTRRLNTTATWNHLEGRFEIPVEFGEAVYLYPAADFATTRTGNTIAPNPEYIVGFCPQGTVWLSIGTTFTTTDTEAEAEAILATLEMAGPGRAAFLVAAPSQRRF